VLIKICNICVLESKPQLHINQAHVAVAVGDLVTLTCSVTYRNELKVTVTLTEASRTIDVVSSLLIGEDNYTVTATVRAKKPQFGPFRCLAVFTQPDNTSDELAQNSVELRSNEISALPLACTFLHCQLSVA